MVLYITKSILFSWAAGLTSDQVTTAELPVKNVKLVVWF